ncbi:hypothetical protein C343_06113 [Cryptococcus neoformans C23]|uniref:Uncharacterized protein n=2 Tax=Cryptococcus neoformans TaxID=5207 RepID=A0A854QCR9_CRYNE|nr:hypothetical protein CNAG_08006 [Cryptococcus neoformans var. grubii H99]AUB28042.1 hypothetical protein CKF44_08006 [Cryptococcus neoformans var. grubii]OWZ27725.1 hypothetical protein C347_06152 [Cryptococcus neoformans var. grubii AD2-60a]OWZ31871.1 hypothetical protein C353_06015 [Cryptococcus neoformans var. grubii AD1-83a]OWZ40029.1 hypothetical protein C343_06113 [Cryptococcus neoformans var. grubii C23]OXC81910.1 hypothetical protein C344_05834 [Cryptococcus neoformans var. grubii A|eukprot:XP_012052944.1 hypothetical protein CNAG_08006 [Cryptococcus neoformans var. grubii H99]
MQRSPRVSYRHQHRGNIRHPEGQRNGCHYYPATADKSTRIPSRLFLIVVADLLLVTIQSTQPHILRDIVFPQV